MQIEKIDQTSPEKYPLLYLGTTPLIDRLGSPTSALFLTANMHQGGLQGNSPENSSTEDLTTGLIAIIESLKSPIERNGGSLYVIVEASNPEDLWTPVIEALQEHYR